MDCDRRRNEKEEVEIRGVKVKERKVKAEEEVRQASETGECVRRAQGTSTYTLA